MIHDGSGGMTRKETVVNGNRTCLSKYSDGHENNQNGRQVAAALPRDMDGLRRVDATSDGAEVWLETPDGAADEMRTFEPPAGYEIAHISHFADGTLCMELEVADD